MRHVREPEGINDKNSSERGVYCLRQRTDIHDAINIIQSFHLLQGRDATPYLERNRVGRDAIDSAAALTDMGKYLFRERRLPVYDIAVAITK